MKFKRLQRFFCRCWVLSCSALTNHERRALLRATDPETRRLWFLSPTHTTNGTSPPNMAAHLNPNVSAAAAAACMSAGGRVWWWAVSRSRTPTTRCRAGAYANGITPVCVGGRWTSVDVAVWATGWCRGATTDGSAHTRGRQDQPNDKDPWAWVSADTVPTTGCNPWVLAIALRPPSRQSTDTGGFGPMRSCRSARASRRLHSSS